MGYRGLIMKIVLLILILNLVSFANMSVHKSATILKSLYPNSSAIELKNIVLKKAKLEAAKEIFGEFLLSETVMQNGQVIDDIVRESHGGVIHIKGEPNFIDSENEIKVTIDAYATKEDIDDVRPHKIIINNFSYSNPLIALKDIKQYAKDAFILEAISRKKPSVKDISEARKLALEVDINKEGFDINTLSYTISGSVTYIPAFLRQDVSMKNENYNKNTSEQKPKRKEKKDFYGKWSGFLLNNSGKSSSVEITITSFSQASILYKSLKCGGDLIVKDKNTNKVIFKEILTFGVDKCQQNSIVSIQRITPKSLQFKQEYDSKKLFYGRVYLEE